MTGSEVDARVRATSMLYAQHTGQFDSVRCVRRNPRLRQCDDVKVGIVNGVMDRYNLIYRGMSVQ